MQTPEASAAPAPEKEKPSRRRRGCLIMFIIAALLMPGFYWFENWSGRRALEKVVAEYEAAGLSLDPATFLSGPVPAEENFGATPLLDGIMHLDDGSQTARAAQVKRKVLKDLLPLRVSGITAPVKKAPKGSATPAPAPALPVVTVLPDLTVDKPEWDKVRSFLGAHTVCKPPADEPSDVRAVYAALEVHRAVFDELIAAAQRPRAVFTPAPVERAAAWGRSDTLTPTEVMAFGRLLHLRVAAAAATGQHEEAVGLLKVIWKLRTACAAESRIFSQMLSRAFQGTWRLGVKSVLRSTGVTGAHLAELAVICPGDWSPEQELIAAFRGDAAWLQIALPTQRAEALATSSGTGLSKRQERVVRLGPAGWVELNGVTNLSRMLKLVLRPLQYGGFGALPPAHSDFHGETYDSMERWSPYRMLQSTYGEDTMLPMIVSRSLHIRLTLLAIAMERYRLQHGRYPADAAALVPDCIAAIPPDMDGAPLRIVTSPDGASAVLYSIGWNLTDDWHGVIPMLYKEAEEFYNDDWPLALPFPPLPPP